MTPAEIKAAANAKIVLLDDLLAGNVITLNLSPANVPDDQRAEALLKQADTILAQTGRVQIPRRAARIRELLSRYVST